jgi:hypothetical protein
MSAFDLELLSEQHDRTGFHCDIESLERYLRETARGHLSKGMSVTRVLVQRDARPPKPILGYFTLTASISSSEANTSGMAVLSNPLFRSTLNCTV